ncbi:MAG: NADH-quinone oxidoreductase subunit NuoI [Trueperaceae bacterium]
MSLLDIAKGMGVTLGHLFKKPYTVNYPEEKIDIKPRFRGRHHLLRHPDTGLEKCIGCSLCAAACPSYAIYVEAAENDQENPVSAGERYAKIYEINMLRCIFCGFCEEACPTGAVVLGHEFELADFRYEDFVYRKEDMLVGTEGSKWQRREADAKGKEVNIGVKPSHRPELEGVDY